MTNRWHVWGRRAALGVAVLAALALVGLAAFPWGVLRGRIEARLSDRIGRPVRVSAVERLDTFGFSPQIAIRDVVMPQAAWAGPGELARIGEVRLRFAALPLLLGRFRPERIAVSGVRATLVRATDGRTNWSRPDRTERGGGRGPDLSGLTVSDTIVTYRDAKRDRSATAAITADPRTGVRIAGRGLVRGAPVTLAIAGPPVRPGTWPVRARIRGQALAMRVSGTLDRPLDVGAMTLTVSARASDLRYIDAVIEAGLTGTQPVRMRAAVRRDGPRWTVTDLAGTVGRSDFRGRISVDKSSGRNVIDGAVRANTLDFADLASDEALARTAAQIAREGPRIVPATPIDLKNLRNTDGRLVFRARRVVSRKGPSSITALAGVVTIERQRMRVSTVRIGLRRSAIVGEMTVDQRGGARVPMVDIDLRLKNSSLGALSEGARDVGGRLDAVVRLRGRGLTIRDAVAHSSGGIGVSANGGALPERLAAAMGFDAGRALLADKDDRAGLRCLVARIEVRGGRGRVDPLVIDTTQSQARGSGTLTFPGETLALRLTGAPKAGSVLRVPGAAIVGGRLQLPTIDVTRETKSAGNILKAIGRAIVGGNGPKATDADCRALSARALR